MIEDDAGPRLPRKPQLASNVGAHGALSLLGATLERSGDGILSVHRAGSVVTYNRRFLELWSIPDAVAARSDNTRLISFVLDQLVDPVTFLRITRDNQADPSREYFSLLRFRNGRVVERFSRARYDAEKVTGRILTFRDVTEREHLLERAYDALHAREEFVAVAQNVVPAPLAALSLAVQSLLENAPPREASPRLLELSHRDEPRLARVFQQLVDLSRLRAGALRLPLAPVNLARVVRDAVARATDSTAPGSVVVRAVHPVIGRWNRSGLDQVVWNLLANAMELERGGRIEVSAAEHDGKALLRVFARGAGLSADARRRLFEPPDLGRLVRDEDGGLDLYVARTIVEALGGSVDADGRLGLGTAFEVELPLDGPTGFRKRSRFSGSSPPR